MEKTEVRVGAVPTNLKRTQLSAEDGWKDTPYFGPGLTEDSKHMKAFPAGSEIAGTLRVLRTTKAEKEKDQKDYLCMEDLEGNKFRIGAPGQLYYLAEKAGIGARIVIVYKGKEFVASHNKELHQFQVDLIEGNVQ